MSIDLGAQRTTTRLLYPKLAQRLTAADLHRIFGPTHKEPQWAPTVARSPSSQVALLVHLRIFQAVGRFLERFKKMTFVVSTKKLENMPQWAKVSEVFKTDEDAPFLERAGIEKVSDPRYRMYSQRLARLRGIRKYIYRMDVLERRLSYDEVTEIFVRVNSLGAKLRSSDLAHKEGSGGQWQQMGCQGLDPQGIAAAIESLL